MVEMFKDNRDHIVYSVLCDVRCVFSTGHFVMVHINLTCAHCLQHFFFEHLFHFYCYDDKYVKKN